MVPQAVSSSEMPINAVTNEARYLVMCVPSQSMVPQSPDAIRSFGSVKRAGSSTKGSCYRASLVGLRRRLRHVLLRCVVNAGAESKSG